MPQYNVAEAKNRLSELLERALLGEEVIIAKDNKPLARITPLTPASRKPGKVKGIVMTPDFDAPLEDFEAILR
jgi:prevent-host-death family protein